MARSFSKKRLILQKKTKGSEKLHANYHRERKKHERIHGHFTVSLDAELAPNAPGTAGNWLRSKTGSRWHPVPARTLPCPWHCLLLPHATSSPSSHGQEEDHHSHSWNFPVAAVSRVDSGGNLVPVSERFEAARRLEKNKIRINQLITQSTNRLINQSINQSINQLINQPIDWSKNPQ